MWENDIGALFRLMQAFWLAVYSVSWQLQKNLCIMSIHQHHELEAPTLVRTLFATCLMLVTTIVGGCSLGSSTCTQNSDCPAGHICASTGVCLKVGPQPDGTGTDGNGLLDVPPLECEPPLTGELVLNELLADPGSELDANKDMIFSSTQDEFIEFVNGTDREILLTNVEVLVKGQVKHTFPPGCLAAGQAVVVFSGGSIGDATAFEGALPVISNGSLTLTNAGAQIALRHNGIILDTVTFGTEGAKDQALTRFPDIIGEWTLHTETPGGLAMSPGSCSSGNAFPDCDEVIQPPTDTTDTTSTIDTSDTSSDVTTNCKYPLSGSLVINEILADPPANQDINGDANASSSQDEFLELIVLDLEAIDMTGVEIYIKDALKHTFPAGCYQPDDVVLIFSGGTPVEELFPRAEVLTSDKALGLTNSGAEVRLQAPNGNTLDIHSYGTEGGDNQSITRYPDGTGPFQLHTDVPTSSGSTMSPGVCVDGGPYPDCSLPPL